ncbi:MAG: hypothetical protein IJU94_01275 [Clostridia bacterium]|nr:hypothetical protein [Clostridia bacterium]
MKAFTYKSRILDLIRPNFYFFARRISPAAKIILSYVLFLSQPGYSLVALSTLKLALAFFGFKESADIGKHIIHDGL